MIDPNAIRNDPSSWPGFWPVPIIAHDVGRSHDRSTAVVGGNSPFQSDVIGIEHLEELPQGLCGSSLANELAVVHRRYNSNGLIVADVSNDPTYAEVLFDTFGPHVIGVHITRNGDGMSFERRLVRNSAVLVYTIGRSYLLELFRSRLESNQVRFVDGPNSRRAYEQLEALETELTDSGTIYRCPPGRHDDLGISCAMLVWAARHPHLPSWVRPIVDAHRPRKPRQKFNWLAVT